MLITIQCLAQCLVIVHNYKYIKYYLKGQDLSKSISNEIELLLKNHLTKEVMQFYSIVYFSKDLKMSLS